MQIYKIKITNIHSHINIHAYILDIFIYVQYIACCIVPRSNHKKRVSNSTMNQRKPAFLFVENTTIFNFKNITHTHTATISMLLISFFNFYFYNNWDAQRKKRTKQNLDKDHNKYIKKLCKSEQKIMIHYYVLDVIVFS